MENILRKDKRPTTIKETDIATALISRDYKGLSNFANVALEVYEINEQDNKA